MRIVSRAQQWAESMARIMEEARSIQAEIAALGGAAAISGYFEDEAGDPRTDLGITFAEFSALFTSAGALDTYGAAGHATNIYAALKTRGVPR